MRVARAAGLRGALPSRYTLPEQPWTTRIRELERTLDETARILDIGAGATPSIPLGRRPRGCSYVGLDVDERELQKAPGGSYDEIIVGEISPPSPRFAESFDVALCYRTLEHVPSMHDSLSSAARYLRPGGLFLAQTSARYAGFALVNRLLPNDLAPGLLERITGRRRDTVFPALYDSCWYSALVTLFADWRSAEIRPLYYGASYVRALRPALAGYLFYEEMAYRRQAANLATHYILEAIR